jgi:hypothetical protein
MAVILDRLRHNNGQRRRQFPFRSPLGSPEISGMRTRQQIFAIWLESLGRLGSLWFIRWLRPVFRIGRDPAVSLFLGRKIPDVRDGAISSAYGNGPTTVLDHFRVKFGFFAHPNNTRLQQNGSISNSASTIKLSATGGPIAGPAGLTHASPGFAGCHVPADRRHTSATRRTSHETIFPS